MSPTISRDCIVEELESVRYDRFLFYLMGPYRSFSLEHILTEAERSEIDIEELPGPLRRLFGNQETVEAGKALLRRIQGALRHDPGVNAYLAVDMGIDPTDIEAIEQSIRFTEVSNATAFVVPFLGRNFGVGEETGSVLETLAETRRDRIIFVHEADVTSEMIRSARVRWDLRVERYETEEELVGKLRRFAAEVMHRERRNELDRLD